MLPFVVGILACLSIGIAQEEKFSVEPENPTGMEMLNYSVANPAHGCCWNYHNMRVTRNQRVGEQSVVLYNEVESFDICACPVRENTVSFSSPPLYPGEYKVQHAETAYCDTSGGKICPIDIVRLTEVGVISVSDPTGEDIYSVERTGAICLVEPCGYFKVTNHTTKETTEVGAVQDTTGLYACAHCRDIPWWEMGVQVKGFFHEDSLDNWIQKGTTFAITGVAPSTPVINEAEKWGSRHTFYSSEGGLVIHLEKDWKGYFWTELFDASGTLVLQKSGVGNINYSESLPPGLYWVKIHFGEKLKGENRRVPNLIWEKVVIW